MPGKLVHNQYGKQRVRVSKIKRKSDRHEFVEAAIDALLEGDFAASYAAGDNTKVIATDSIRNTIYVKAKDDPWTTIESLGVTLAKHFIDTYPHVTRSTITLREHLWHRIGKAPAAFVGSDGETPTAIVTLQRGGKVSVTAGLDNLMIAKTTDSAFKNFVTDEYRTLPDTDDRVFATVLTATWRYTDTDMDFAAARAAIRSAMLDTFANHMSLSVQQSLNLMGQAALQACATIDQITLTMPNKHHLKFNLASFGRENNNEVFHVTDEPAGWITGTLSR
ncbi:MAG: urate oxidase [Planctomycetes bacterium]|nr:urate oxidase [Planctomycetota bacterium]